VAELQVLELTDLAPTGDVLHVEVVRRADWIAAAMEDYRPLVELAAGRMSDALVRGARRTASGGGCHRRRCDGPPSASARPRPSSGNSVRCSRRPQVGQVFGFLASRVFGGYDVGVPRQAAESVRFVLANIEAFERDWSLDPREFRTFVALHQIAHRLQSAQPWLPAHATAAVDDFCSSMTIDVDAIRERFASISPEDPEAFSAAFADEEGSMFGIVLDDEQRLKLDRVRALIGAVEGYGDHVATTIGARLLGTYPKIEEAMRRHREDEELDPIFARLLGVDVGREHVAAGRAFCETVVELTDEATLGRMWDSADALPGLAELQEPRLWLARTV
jgi:putative hydrolase